MPWCEHTLHTDQFCFKTSDQSLPEEPSACSANTEPPFCGVSYDQVSQPDGFFLSLSNALTSCVNLKTGNGHFGHPPTYVIAMLIDKSISYSIIL